MFPRFGINVSISSPEALRIFSRFDGRYPMNVSGLFNVDVLRNIVEECMANRSVIVETRRKVKNTASKKLCYFEEKPIRYENLSSLLNASSHDNSVLLHDEDVLNASTSFLTNFRLPESLVGKNYFEFFPNQIIPGHALYISGKGYRSHLHCDPFQWTGYNLLLEGIKIWTFLPSYTPSSFLLPIVVRPPKNTLSFSTRLESPVDLYHTIEGLSVKMLLDEHDKKHSNLNSVWVASLRDHVLKSSTVHRNGEVSLSCNEMFSRNMELPVFNDSSSTSAMRDGDALHSALQRGAYQIVQHPGETIFIPPGYWHQVYHVTSTVAIASQYCNARIKEHVFDHIHNWVLNREYKQVASLTMEDETKCDLERENHLSAEEVRLEAHNRLRSIIASGYSASRAAYLIRRYRL